MSVKSSVVENKIVNEISEKIWSTFNILRGELSADDFHIVLFFLTLKRIGFKSDFLLKSDECQVIVYDFLKSYDQNHNSNILDTYGVYKPLLQRLPKEKIFQLFAVIDSIDSSLLENNFISIFDNILYSLLQSLGKFSGEFVLPLELSRFMTSLVSIPKNAKIYNPFAGAASFGILTNEQNEYLGQEINQTTWVIGKLRLLASGFSSNKTIILGDSIKEWNPFHLKYDLIIASPPFGVRIPFAISGKFGTIRNFENFMIEKGLEDLKNDGKLIILVPESFLFSSGTIANLRYHLIDEDLIESVISLPSGVLHHTAIKTSVLVINKAKKNKGFINFIDANDFVIKDKVKFKILDDKSLIDIINNGVESNCYKKVSINTVINSDRVLDCQRYFLEDFHGVKLQEFATRIRGAKIDLSESEKWVKIKDLMDDSLNFNLDTDKIEEVEVTRPVSRIDESCILISKIGRTLKPTFFEYANTPIVISEDILALRIDQKIALPIFIIMEFYKDYVIEQAGAYRKGATIPFINVSDILAIKFSLPSIAEQKGQVQTYLELSAKLNDLEQQRENLKKGFNKLQFNEFASLKHSLGTPRQNILSNSKTLIRFFEKDDSPAFKEIETKFRERYDIGLIEVFNQVKNDINQISTILEKGEKGLIVSNYAKELIPLESINRFIGELSSNGFNFQIDPKLLNSVDCNGKAVEINLTLLKILFDNIFTNANKYGFNDFEESNTVMIELALIGNQLEIAIKNNGKPFPKNYNKEKFISKYSTSNATKGTGIGGYDINRIATYFENEDWALELNTNPLYPVIFKFLFPIKSDDKASIAFKAKLTLHEAIVKLLHKSGSSFTTVEIANALNNNKWYLKGDGSNIKSSQIGARVNKYQNLFNVDRSVSPLQIKLFDNNYEQDVNSSSTITEKSNSISSEPNSKKSFDPISNDETSILILGTLPGDKSLELGEYYGHPKNRFWKIIATITNNDLPQTYSAKKQLLFKTKIGIWDVAHKANRKGSIDKAIEDEDPNNLDLFIESHKNLKVIGFNGAKSEALFNKYFERKEEIKYISLPSSSPANTEVNFERICEKWNQLLIKM